MRTTKNLSAHQRGVGTNFKKAQSMETLLVGGGAADSCSISSTVGRRLLSARIFNSSNRTSSNAREKSPSPVSKFSDIFRFSNKSDGYVRQTSAPSIHEDELPRPDTVKHYKRIFESQPQQVEDNKTCHSTVNHTNENKIVPPICGQAARPASVPSTLAFKSSNGAIVSKNAALPHHNVKSSSESSGKSVITDARNSSAKDAVETTSSQISTISEAVTYEECDSCESDAQISSKSRFQSRVSNNDIISPEINKERDYLFISENSEGASVSTTPEEDDLNVRAKGTDVLSCGDTFSEFFSSKVNTSHPSPQREESSCDEDTSDQKEEEAFGQAERNKEEFDDVASQVVSVTERDLYPTEEVSDSTPNGEVMVVAASEQRLRMGPDVARAQIGAARKPSNWQKPPPATTSIVFDFRGKDVKPNISLNPAPFGCRPAKVKKRSGSPPRNGDDSKVNGTNHYEDDDEDDDEDWDEMDIGADLPAISGIVFTGENVKVGKGSLLERRNKNLTIQFDDGATSTYEYPCESPSDEIGQSPDDSPHNLKSSLAISSSSGLSSYTPNVLNSSESEFKLGVSRPPVLRYTSSSSMPKKCESPVTAVDELIPATPEDSSGWSSTDSADILF